MVSPPKIGGTRITNIKNPLRQMIICMWLYLYFLYGSQVFSTMTRFIFYSVRTLIYQQSPKLVLTDSDMGLMLIASANLITKIR